MQGSARNSALVTPPLPTPAAIADLRRQPRFSQALALIAVNSVAFYQRRWLADRLLSDRARFGMSALIMYLHYTGEPGAADSGLTAARLRDVCVQEGVCGAGRVESLLLMMRATGFIERVAEADRSVRRYAPTAKLMALNRQRHRQVLSALDILRGDTHYLARINTCNEDDVYQRFVVSLGRTFLAGYRVINAAPELRKVIDRDAGLPLMMCVVLACPQYAPLVEEAARPTGVAELAQRFGVSRTHVRSVLRDAETDGLLIRHGDSSPVTALPGLIDAMENFFASAFAIAETCARTALGEEI